MSDTYVEKWEELGISRDGDHAKLAYDWYGSWTTLYNLFGDALLCFHLDGTELSMSNSVEAASFGDAAKHENDQKPIKPSPPDDNESRTGFVPHHIYKLQSDFYYGARQKYGLPLDNRHLYTKTDWEFFAMAVASNKTRSTILTSVAKWLNETITDKPFTDLHQTEAQGGWREVPTFFARPVVGGHFAFLALERACGGKAMEGLKFLEVEEKSSEQEDLREKTGLEMGSGEL